MKDFESLNEVVNVVARFIELLSCLMRSIHTNKSGPMDPDFGQLQKTYLVDIAQINF